MEALARLFSNKECYAEFIPSQLQERDFPTPDALSSADGVDILRSWCREHGMKTENLRDFLTTCSHAMGGYCPPRWYKGCSRVLACADHIASAALSDFAAMRKLPAAAQHIQCAVGEVQLPRAVEPCGMWDFPVTAEAGSPILHVPLSHLCGIASLSRALMDTQRTAANLDILLGTPAYATPSPPEAGIKSSAREWVDAIDAWCPSCTLWDARPDATHTLPTVSWTLHSMRSLAHLLHTNPAAETAWCDRAMYLSSTASQLAQQPLVGGVGKSGDADAIARLAWYCFMRVVEAATLLGMPLQACVPRVVMESIERGVDADADASIGKPSYDTRTLSLALFGTSHTAQYVDAMLCAVNGLRVTLETFSPPGSFAADVDGEEGPAARTTHLPLVASLLTMCDHGAALPSPRLANGGLVVGVRAAEHADELALAIMREEDVAAHTGHTWAGYVNIEHGLRVGIIRV